MHYLIIIIVVMHWFDMLFTVLLIKKMKKIYKNPEIAEFNYHRWFLKRFGLYKGALISLVFISTPFFILLCSIAKYLYGIEILYYIFGMVTMIAYLNMVSWLTYDELKKNLVKIEDDT